MPTRYMFLIALLSLSSAANAQTIDRNSGRNIASNCANCHGTNGKSVGGMPALAGLPADFISRQMREFRDGKRPATIMHQLSKGYTDEQIDAVASYLSAQKSN